MKIIIENRDGTPTKGYEIGAQDKPPGIIIVGMWCFVFDKTECRGPAQDEYAIYREAVTLRLVGGENAAPITGDEWADIELEASRKSVPSDENEEALPNVRFCGACGESDGYHKADCERVSGDLKDVITTQSGAKIAAPAKPLPETRDRTAEDEAFLAKLKGKA